VTDITLIIIQAGAMISTFSFMFSSGLRTHITDLKYFLSRQGLLLRSLISVDVLVPLIALVLILLIKPAKSTAIGLLLMASSPAAPMVLKKITKASGKHEFAISLHVVLAFLAIITTPVTLYILSSVSEYNLAISPMAVAKAVGFSILLPILAGAIIRWIFPALAEFMIRPLEIFSNIISLLLAIIVLLFTYQMLLMLDITSYVVIALMIIGAMAAGHLMARGQPDEQATLALESATRNPGLALLIASTYVSLEKAMPVLIPYLITSTIIGFIYVRYRKMNRKTGSHAGSD
jgi:bile acid:Na+ symporter, BASS family